MKGERRLRKKWRGKKDERRGREKRRRDENKDEERAEGVEFWVNLRSVGKFVWRSDEG